MKRYKLLKDLPTFKAGDKFYLDSNNNLRLSGSEIIAYSHITLEEFPNILKDWFEEIYEYKRRRVEIGSQYYYYIDDSGNIECKYDYGNLWDNYRHDTGNYGLTKEELEAKREYDIARQVLLDDAEGGKFIPDGNNYVGSYSCGTWDSTFVCNYFTGDIYFKTEEALEKSLKVHKEQWEIIRKYETEA